MSSQRGRVNMKTQSYSQEKKKQDYSQYRDRSYFELVSKLKTDLYCKLEKNEEKYKNMKLERLMRDKTLRLPFL